MPSCFIGLLSWAYQMPPDLGSSTAMGNSNCSIGKVLILTSLLSIRLPSVLTITFSLSARILSLNEAMLVDSNWVEAWIGCYIGFGFSFSEEREAIISQ